MSGTIVYQYDVDKSGLTEEAADYVDRQLQLCRAYRNKLIELERERRRLVNEARLQLFPHYDAVESAFLEADAAVKALLGQVSKQNSKARNKRTATPEQRAALSQARAARKVAAKRLKEVRDQLWDDETFQAELEAIEEGHGVRRKAARRWCSRELGLYSFSYVGVEDSLRDIRKGAPPEFKKWDGSGRLCCQIQLNKAYWRPVTWERVLSGEDTRLRARAEGKLTIVSIRLGSTGKGGRSPLWVDCPIVMHRGLPEDAVVKWVYLIRRRAGLVGNRARNRTETVWSYKVCFVLSRERGFDKEDRAPSGRVAIDVAWRGVEGTAHNAWRQVDAGVRAAYWVGDDGRHGQLVIPDQKRAYYEYVEELQSRRDNLFNDMMDRLRPFVASLGDDAPEWLREVAPHLHVIRSKRRILELMDAWGDDRLPGDGEVWSAMCDWRRRELRTYRQETNQRRKFERWRKDFYRRWWAEMRRRYRTAVVEKLDLAEMRRRPLPTEERSAGLIRYRNLVSVGTFLGVASMDLVRTAPEFTTVRCHACGGLCDWDAAAELEHTCEHCGAHWDQDYNACHNLFAQADADAEAAAAGAGEGEGDEATAGEEGAGAGGGND